MTGDRYTDCTLAQVLVPFASVNYWPVWVGLGQVGLYLMALVTASFYVWRWIGYRIWRVVHYLSFGVLLLALIHGTTSGTDSTASIAQMMYWASGISLAAMTLQRIARVRLQQRGASVSAHGGPLIRRDASVLH